MNEEALIVAPDLSQIRKAEIDDELINACSNLRLEAIHYMENGIGEQFLKSAIERAERAICKARVIL